MTDLAQLEARAAADLNEARRLLGLPTEIEFATPHDLAQAALKIKAALERGMSDIQGELDTLSTTRSAVKAYVSVDGRKPRR